MAPVPYFARQPSRKGFGSGPGALVGAGSGIYLEGGGKLVMPILVVRPNKRDHA